MSKYIYNFVTRFLFFWIISALILQKTLLGSLFFGLIMAAGFTFFDFLFGPPGDPKKQNKNVVRIVAGQNLQTAKDKYAWVFVNIILLVGGFFAITGILNLFAGEVFWIWIVGAISSVLLYVWITHSAKYHVKKQQRKKK